MRRVSQLTLIIAGKQTEREPCLAYSWSENQRVISFNVSYNRGVTGGFSTVQCWSLGVQKRPKNRQLNIFAEFSCFFIFSCFPYLVITFFPFSLFLYLICPTPLAVVFWDFFIYVNKYYHFYRCHYYHRHHHHSFIVKNIINNMIILIVVLLPFSSLLSSSPSSPS